MVPSVVRERWPIKIGYSSGVPGSRFNQFESMLPEKIHLAAEWRCDTKKNAEKKERYLQDQLSDCRIKGLPGSEWYMTNPEDICAKIEKLLNLFP